MEALGDQQRLALNLAQAEVRLRSVLHTIDEFEQEHDPLFEERANQEHDHQLYLRFARNRDLDKWTRDSSKILLQIIKKISEKVRGRLKIAHVSCSATNGKHNPSSVKLRKPGVINSRENETQNPKRNFPQLKGEIFTSEYSNAMLTKPTIEQRKHVSECHACNIHNPILHIRTAPEGRLDNLYETAKRACANKDWD